jgi:transcriptional antiterminator RfaH
VTNLVKFGESPAKVHDELIEHMYSREHFSEPKIQPLYRRGQTLKIVDGPFSGFDSIYHGMDPEMRVMVLIEFMSKPLILRFELNQIKK